MNSSSSDGSLNISIDNKYYSADIKLTHSNITDFISENPVDILLLFIEKDEIKLLNKSIISKIENSRGKMKILVVKEEGTNLIDPLLPFDDTIKWPSEEDDLWKIIECTEWKKMKLKTQLFVDEEESSVEEFEEMFRIIKNMREEGKGMDMEERREMAEKVLHQFMEKFF